jgi:predicted PurR-regulated permease PerM
VEKKPALRGGERLGSGQSLIVRVAALFVVVAGLKLSGEVILPFLVAMFLTFLTAPLVLWIERRLRWPAWAAVLVVVTSVLACLLVFSALLGSTVRDFKAAVPLYKARLIEQGGTMVAWLQDLGVDVTMADLYQSVEPGQIFNILGSTLNGILGALTNTATVVLILVFALFEVAGFSRKLRVAFAEPDVTIEQGGRIAREIQRYLGLKTLISIATAFTVTAWVWFMGVDFPLLWGVIAFFLNFIPTIGSIIAAIPACTVALVMLGPSEAGLVGLGYLLINAVWGNVVEPKVMGESLGLSALVVFVSLIVWGWIWGPVGMLLSVPLTMVVKIVLEEIEELRWVAVLLGPAPPDEKAGSPARSR